MPLHQCYRARTINVLNFELFTLFLRHNSDIQSSIRRGTFHCSLFPLLASRVSSHTLGIHHSVMLIYTSPVRAHSAVCYYAQCAQEKWLKATVPCN